MNQKLLILRVFCLALVWVLGSFYVLSANFYLEFKPDTNSRVSFENTIQGYFFPESYPRNSSFTPSSNIFNESSRIDDELNNVDVSTKLALTSSMIFLGWMFGAPAFSALTDRFGRKPSALLSLLFLIVGCLGSLLAGQNYTLFLLFRVITGIAVGANGIISFVWGLELESTQMNHETDTSDLNIPEDSKIEDTSDNYSTKRSPSASRLRRTPSPQRAPMRYSSVHSHEFSPVDPIQPPTSNISAVLIGAFFQLSWNIGAILLSPCAYFIPNWRLFHWVLLVSTIITGLLVFIIVPESPQWLAKQEQVFLNGAAYNTLPDNPTSTANTLSNGFNSKYDNIKKLFAPIIGLISPPYLPLTLTFAFIWFSNSLIYYGLSLSANKLNGSVYIISILMSLVSLPGILFAQSIVKAYSSVINRDRTEKNAEKRILAIGMGLVGICFGIMAICQFSIESDADSLSNAVNNLGIAVTSFSIIGEMIVSLTFTLCYSITTLGFPTKIRASGLGLSVMCGRIGALSAPILVAFYPSKVGGIGTLAFVFFSFVCCACSVLVWVRLPEKFNLEDVHVDINGNSE